MNPLACRVVLRPRGALELVDLAVALLRADAGTVGRLAAIVLAPVAALSAVAFLVEPWAALGVAWVGGWFVQPVFTAWVARRLFADAVPLGALRDDLGPIGSAVVLRVVAALIVTFTSPLTCGVSTSAAPWVVLWVGEVRQLERLRPEAAFRRALELVGEAGVSLPTGLLLVLLPPMGAVAGEIVGQTLVFALLDLGLPWGLAVLGQGTPFLVAGVLVVQPLLAALRVLAYVDARTRREGWDVQVAVRGLAVAR